MVNEISTDQKGSTVTSIVNNKSAAAGLRSFAEAGSEMIDFYRANGFALLQNALDPEEVAELEAEAIRLCRGELGAIAGAQLTAGHDEASADGSDDDALRQFLCIHYPHKVSPASLRALTKPQIVAALQPIIGANIKSMQSMLFIKSEGKPGQPWHQDEYFIPTRDRSLTAVWIALDDATVDNGCLWVLPGSHQRGVIYPDREQDDPRFDCSIEAYDFPYNDGDAVPVEMPAGTALIFNGYLLHRSLGNSSHGYRRALVNHYMSAESLLPWRSVPDGDHVGKHDFRDIVLVSGVDPYAYKGIDDVSRPMSRRDKDGGCDR